MKIVGLTGGIGSGKSTVARAFKNLGIPVFIADEESKKILAEDPEAVAKVKALLGNDSYLESIDGITVPDKKYIASQVFNNKSLLAELNKILHPLVRISFKEWLKGQHAKFVVYEAAILFESGGDKICDKVITVWSRESERISRVVSRDKVKESTVRLRLKNQWDDKKRLEKSDFLIINEDLQSIPVFAENIKDIMLK